MSLSDDPPHVDHGLHELAARFTDISSRNEGSSVPDEVLQSTLTACIKIYGQKFDAGQRLRPLPSASSVDATTLLLAVTAILRSANIELFELGMFQAFSGIR